MIHNNREQRLGHKCRCGTPIDDRYLCTGCEVRCHNWLMELVELNGELHLAMAREVAMTERNNGGKSAETALPFAPRAAESIRSIRKYLAECVRVIHEDTGTPMPVNNSIGITVDWLLDLLPEIVRHRPDASQIYYGLKEQRNDASSVIDLQPRTFRLGPCPEKVEAGPCDGTVRVFIPVEEDRPARVFCRTCETAWTGEQWPHLAQRISALPGNHDPVVDIEAAAHHLGIGKSTLRRWLRLGLLLPPRKGYVRLSDAWRVREELGARRRERLAQYAV